MSPFGSASSTHRSPSKTSNESTTEPDILAGLWQEAPFVRLPPDAPPELLQYVIDIEDPRRVYAIHRASRRHDFQLLIERFMHQLRQGCGVSNCVMPTCFTCRKRISGKTPLRRYNISSARTLAVYLASRDNPEDALCLALRYGKDVSGTSLNNLIFETRSRHGLFPHEPSRVDGHAAISMSKYKSRYENKPAKGTSSSRGDKTPPKPKQPVSHHGTADQEPSSPEERMSAEYDFAVRERPSNKDHRSFAANVFGTVAFRMLEWLTPQGHAAMKENWSVENMGTETSKYPYGTSKASSLPSPGTEMDSGLASIAPSLATLASELPDKLSSDESLSSASNMDPIKSRRNSEALLRTMQQSSKPSSRKSLDLLPQESEAEEPRSPTISSKMSFKKGSKALSRNVVEISKVFETKQLQNPQTSITQVETTESIESIPSDNDESSDEQPHTSEPESDTEGYGIQVPSDVKVDETVTVEVDCPLPQTLSRLNTEIVEFICNTFEEDHTSESHPLDEFEIREAPSRPRSKITLTRRRSYGKVTRKQWKAFNEQTLFHVLSNPRSLIRSFSENGRLFDSETICYCMRRLTQAKPSLVWHSLWMAAESLFHPPKLIHNSGNDAKGPSSSASQGVLSDFERVCVMSICLHALVGALPAPTDHNMVADISLIRSKGLTLSYFGHVLKQPPWLVEQYDDIFSDELAIRLARRLCCAVTAQQQFVKALKSRGIDGGLGSAEIIRSVVNHITVIGVMESSSAISIDPSDRLLYEGRAQLVILDWARTVLLHDWNGSPVFPTNSPFAGALALIKAMYDYTPGLIVVGDARFSTDYFSDRLDSLEVAIEWLDFVSTKHHEHLLDHPYIFTPDRIVSYFRSINFARMSRTFEESSSLKTRMKAILERGSLITNPHHKTVLQDLLKTASAKYLVLQIGRDNVLKDAFDQLWRREERELLRPLKVRLGEDGGEEGFDSGGVQQEFFRLAIAECLDPNNGAFLIDDRTHMAWFAPGSLMETWRFEMMGILVSLAVFNGLTLPVTFPKALYCKLLGWPVEDLCHIEDGWPDLASGLDSLLDWDEEDGKVEDVFARTYEFSVFTYGSHVTKQMTPEDSSWPQVAKGESVEPAPVEEVPLVTAANRHAYVKEYIRYLTDVSVRPQYAAFERGFRACLLPKSLTLLDPPLLQSLVEGCQEIDIGELRRYTRYVGWDASHRTVRDFWSIVKRYDENMKRRLLEFVTASDRLPVGGVQNLQFVVQKNGYEEGDGGHLPTAYTCYGTLLLPEYKDKESLRARLAMALENAQGFGFA